MPGSVPGSVFLCSPCLFAIPSMGDSIPFRLMLRYKHSRASGSSCVIQDSHPTKLWHNSTMRCILCLVTTLGLDVGAEMSLTVDKLVAFVKSTIQLKQPDKQVAEYLHHVKMVEKLEDQTIEELQGLGAGPKTVGALKELRDGS